MPLSIRRPRNDDRVGPVLTVVENCHKFRILDAVPSAKAGGGTNIIG